MQSMAGKRALVLGVANNRSIVFPLVEMLREAGVEVVCATAPALMKSAAKALGEEVPLFACDVAGIGKGADGAWSVDESPLSILNLKDELAIRWPEGFDYLIHAVAFADKAELRDDILVTSRGAFLQALDISAYSLLALCRELHELMRDGGAVVTPLPAAAL